MRDRLGVYPGSFDPITNGHVDIVQRSLAIFDRVIIGVLEHPKKVGMFTPAERVALIRETFGDDPRIQVQSFTGLLVEFVRGLGGGGVIRGLRAVQDFEYEFQMTMMNRRLAPDVDTVFFMTDEQHFYIASSTIKEVARHGGDIAGLVPEPVAQALARKVQQEQS